jgi:hypothetical protein
VDEGNNWVNMTYGPLSLANPTLLPESTVAPTAVAPGTGNGNYGLTATSAAINMVPSGTSNFAQAPAVDFFGTPRKTNGAVDAGAVEFVGPAVAVANVTPGSMVFGNVSTNTTSAAQALTLHNTGGAAFTGIAVAFTGQFARATAGGTCGTALTAGSTCTINVVFAPATAGAATGSVTITGSVTVSGSPVSLTGTGVAPVISASLSPPTWAPSAARGSFFGAFQMFTLVNTGNVPLTGITNPVLGGASPADYQIAFSDCGPGILGTATLAPGASCIIFVQFQPRRSDPANSVRNATLSVTDLAGNQSSALTGTAK